MLLVTFTTVQRMTSQFSCQNVASDLLRPRPGIRTLHNADTILSALLVTSFSTNSKFRKQRVSLLFQRYIVYPTLLVSHSFTFSCENDRLPIIIAFLYILIDTMRIFPSKKRIEYRGIRIFENTNILSIKFSKARKSFREKWRLSPHTLH